jgi:hypothetical protein
MTGGRFFPTVPQTPTAPQPTPPPPMTLPAVELTLLGLMLSGAIAHLLRRQHRRLSLHYQVQRLERLWQLQSTSNHHQIEN